MRPSLSQRRRRHPRAEVPATVMLFTRSKVLGPALVQNLSLGGVKVSAPEALRRGQKVTVVLDLPSHAGTSVKAEVRRVERGPGGEYVMGLAFIELSAALQSHLEVLVAQQLLASFPWVEFFDTERGGDGKRLVLGDNPLLVDGKLVSPL